VEVQEEDLVVEVALEAVLAAIVDVEGFLRAVDLVASAAVEVVVVVEAIKPSHCHLDTPKSAKHEGVNRQRRHGVMKGLRTAWEMVHGGIVS